ncbi:MAG: hypothetical protein ACOVOV_01755 [Dolichospermum sp.]
MITVAGTVAALILLLDSCTCSGVSVTRLRVTVAVVLPPFSLILLVSTLRVNVTASLSIIARVSEPLTNPCAVAIMV